MVISCVLVSSLWSTTVRRNSVINTGFCGLQIIPLLFAWESNDSLGGCTHIQYTHLISLNVHVKKSHNIYCLQHIHDFVLQGMI